MKVYLAAIYRNHKMIELVLQAEDADHASKGIKRNWRGWEIRNLHRVLNIPLIWKVNEWTTD